MNAPITKHTRRESMKTLGRMLANARLREGIRQANVAEQIGRTQRWVSMYEAGEYTLEPIEVVRVCELLGLDHGKVLNRMAHVKLPQPAAPKKRVMRCKWCRKPATHRRPSPGRNQNGRQIPGRPLCDDPKCLADERWLDTIGKKKHHGN